MLSLLADNQDLALTANRVGIPVSGRLETLVAEVVGRPLTFCSNVVESCDGTVFFTESTYSSGYEYHKGAATEARGSEARGSEARGSGSLFRLDPDGAVDVLATGLHFANEVLRQ
ncbi:hypothetical protein [Mycobacterium simiae]|uniref:hypothetical protein n=1 Tax=Mycobacterium simiae TaxID=1784 RepID=UPI00165FDBF5|nr:hypothetical protein [Mycobacterium simiae]